eukprot:NODE_599_length_5524_cov_0.451060.p2 type:complete len:378 gc:universal NODE_599_length_5524_cov_0.451060:2530-1397(-)
MRQRNLVNPVPSQVKAIAEKFNSNIYNIRFSDSGDFLAVGTQDQMIHLYDSSDPYFEGLDSNFGIKLNLNLRGSIGQWTMTDLQFHDKFIGHSSLTPFIEFIDFKTQNRVFYSCTEDAAFMSFCTKDNTLFGASKPVTSRGHGKMYAWDMSRNNEICSVEHGRDDCNSVVTVDNHLVATAGDDSIIKLWDTRLLSSNKEQRYVGYIAGHTQGITSLDTLNGTFILSNGKDQKLKLHDLRNTSPSRPKKSKERQYDYRWDKYSYDPKSSTHSEDKSILTCFGHSVYSTMIKAKFSPCGNFISSGSSDGSIYIWNLLGEVISEITTPTDDSDSSSIDYWHDSPIIRDLAWHPSHPVIYAGTFGHSGARYSQMLFINAVY